MISYPHIHFFLITNVIIPTWPTLTQLKDDPNIVIAKSDATANDYPPQFQVQGSVVIYVWVCCVCVCVGVCCVCVVVE